MIISVAAEKAFNKIQHAFFIKILSKLRIVRNFLKLIINEKSTADIHNGGTLNALSLRLGTRQNARSQGFHPHAQKLEPAQAVRRKRPPDWKVGRKMSLFRDNVTLHVDSQMDLKKAIRINIKKSVFKNVTALYAENYKTLPKNIKDLNKRRNKPSL